MPIYLIERPREHCRIRILIFPNGNAGSVIAIYECGSESLFCYLSLDMVSEYLVEPLDDPEHGRIDENALLHYNLQEDCDLPWNQPESRTCKTLILFLFLAVLWTLFRCFFHRSEL